MLTDRTKEKFRLFTRRRVERGREVQIATAWARRSLRSRVGVQDGANEVGNQFLRAWGAFVGGLARGSAPVRARHCSDADAEAGIACQHAGIERCLTIRGKEGVFGMAAHPGVVGKRSWLGG